MGKTPEERAAFLKQIREGVEALNVAIYKCACTYCGAKSGEACISKARKRKAPEVLTSPNPHMARVRAGHSLLRQ